MKKLLLISTFSFQLSAFAQTPITFTMREATGSPLNRTVIFHPLDTPLHYYTNVVYGGDVTVTPVNGLVATNLITGFYNLEFAGLPKTLIKFVPDTTNVVNLMDAQWTRAGLLEIFFETNSFASAAQLATLANAVTNNAVSVTFSNQNAVSFTVYGGGGAGKPNVQNWYGGNGGTNLAAYFDWQGDLNARDFIGANGGIDAAGNVYGTTFTGTFAGDGYAVTNLISSGKQSDKWTKWHTNVFVPTLGWETTCVLEPAVLYEGGRFRMWYTGNGTNPMIGYAESTDAVNWTKFPSPIIGGGVGGAGNAAWHGAIFKDNDGTYYHYHAEGSTSGTVCSSTNGTNFVYAGYSITPANCQAVGNQFVWRIGSTYYLACEYQLTNGVWQQGFATSSVPAGVYPGPFQWILNPATNLIPPGCASSSAGSILPVNGRWQYWYHAQPSPLPSQIYSAWTTNFINWNLTENGAPVVPLGTDSWPGHTPEQIADPEVVVGPNGWTYMFAEYEDNANLASQITVVIFKGGLAQLVSEDIATKADAVTIRGFPVLNTIPKTNQVLSFDGLQYKPATLTNNVADYFSAVSLGATHEWGASQKFDVQPVISGSQSAILWKDDSGNGNFLTGMRSDMADPSVFVFRCLANGVGWSFINGKVGIGTNNPDSLLHVVGNGHFNGTVTAGTLTDGYATISGAQFNRPGAPIYFQFTGGVGQDIDFFPGGSYPITFTANNGLITAAGGFATASTGTFTGNGSGLNNTPFADHVYIQNFSMTAGTEYNFYPFGTAPNNTYSTFVGGPVTSQTTIKKIQLKLMSGSGSAITVGTNITLRAYTNNITSENYYVAGTWIFSGDSSTILTNFATSFIVSSNASLSYSLSNSASMTIYAHINASGNR